MVNVYMLEDLPDIGDVFGRYKDSPSRATLLPLLDKMQAVVQELKENAITAHESILLDQISAVVENLAAENNTTLLKSFYEFEALSRSNSTQSPLIGILHQMSKALSVIDTAISVREEVFILQKTEEKTHKKIAQRTKLLNPEGEVIERFKTHFTEQLLPMLTTICQEQQERVGVRSVKTGGRRRKVVTREAVSGIGAEDLQEIVSGISNQLVIKLQKRLQRLANINDSDALSTFAAEEIMAQLVADYEEASRHALSAEEKAAILGQEIASLQTDRGQKEIIYSSLTGREYDREFAERTSQKLTVNRGEDPTLLEFFTHHHKSGQDKFGKTFDKARLEEDVRVLEDGLSYLGDREVDELRSMVHITPDQTLHALHQKRLQLTKAEAKLAEGCTHCSSMIAIDYNRIAVEYQVDDAKRHFQTAQDTLRELAVQYHIDPSEASAQKLNAQCNKLQENLVMQQKAMAPYLLESDISSTVESTHPSLEFLAEKGMNLQADLINALFDPSLNPSQAISDILAHFNEWNTVLEVLRTERIPEEARSLSGTEPLSVGDSLTTDDTLSQSSESTPFQDAVESRRSSRDGGRGGPTK